MLIPLYIQYEGQEWAKTDADTMFRFYKCEPVESLPFLYGPRNGYDGAPQHTDLSASRNMDDVSTSVYQNGTKVRMDYASR